MSDLYHETSQAETAEPDTVPEPARDTGSGQQYKTAELAGHSYGEYPETDAEVQARIAGQDELPAREESRQATWGDDPDYYDATEPGAEYDGDVDAFLAGEDELPTPQESRAHTWGDNPEYYDEADLASEYDGDPGALTTEEDDPGPRDALAGPVTKDTHAESAISPEDTADSRAQGTDSDNRAQNAAGAADDQLTPAGTDLITTEPGQANERQATADTGTDAQASLSEGDDGNVLSPEADRLKALETDHDAARQKIADLEAELKAVKDEQAARLDRIEQLLAGPEKRPDDASAHEHGSDKPTVTLDQQGARDAVSAKYEQAIAEREDSREGMDTSDARHHGWRRVTSSESLGLANTVAGAADTVAQFAMHATPEGVVSLGLTALGIAVTLKARAEKNAEKGRGKP